MKVLYILKGNTLFKILIGIHVEDVYIIQSGYHYFILTHFKILLQVSLHVYSIQKYFAPPFIIKVLSD